MRLVFLNSWEKKDDSGRGCTAQLSIGEQHGVWFVGWSETGEDGKLHQSNWYEGRHWNEMLTAFHDQCVKKREEGFYALLDPAVFANTGSGEPGSYTYKLQIYSEKHTNEALYEQLRQWRFRQASKESKSVYMVATNRLLKLISAFVPYTEAELLQIPGFGPAKWSRYGKELLAMTAAYPRSLSFPLHWVADTVSSAEVYAWQTQEKERKRKTEADHQEQRKKLLEQIAAGELLTTMQEQLGLSRRDLLQWIEALDKEGYELMPLVDRELDPIPPTELDKAWHAFEEKGERFLKPIVAAVYGTDELKAQDAEQAYTWLRLLRIKFRHRPNDESEAAG